MPGFEWSSLKRAKRCFGCGHGFEDGEGYCSLLFDVDRQLAREDYCPACWHGLMPEKRNGYLSCWRGRYRAEPPREEEEPIGKSAAERLLRKYIDSREPAHVNVRYILALMLERKKRFIQRDIIAEPVTGRRIIVYELAESGESFLIEDPGLEISQARQVQRQVDEILSMDETS